MKRDACSCQKKSTSLFPWTLSLFFLKKELTLYSNLAIIKNKRGRFMNDDFFQALASPYRREIIRLLKWKNLTAGEIADHFDISQPSISRHLDILKRAEIVTAQRKANQMIYSLNLSMVQEMMVSLAELLDRKGENPHECQ